MLFEGPATRPVTAAPTSLPPSTDVREITHAWQLQPLSLVPGTVLSFHLMAEDYKPQAHQTMARRLLVVTPSELIERAGRRQSLLLQTLLES